MQSLVEDLRSDAHLAQGRKIETIFFGGGTPSLFPGHAIRDILEAVDNIIGIKNGAEITLEANPGTAEHDKFSSYRQAGVNRLSMGVQSFQAHHLHKLGRIHSGQEVLQAVELAQRAGFTNFNLDLIHGLEGQTVEEALGDIEQAMALGSVHLSWYQLTIEPNTVFYSKPPTLPVDDVLADIQDAGHNLLREHGFEQYEISAYCQTGKQSAHNLNYWEFGDYLAIGAGAHGKITLADGDILRFNKTRLPKDYLAKTEGFNAHQHTVAQGTIPLEFMMNTMRLKSGFEKTLFTPRTGLSLDSLAPKIRKLIQKGLIEETSDHIAPTPMGHRFLNDLLAEFME